MAAKTKVTEAPWDERGNLMHYPLTREDFSKAVRGPNGGYGWEVPPVRIAPNWRPNVPFEARLKLVGTSRGRSAAYFDWQDADGHEFPMFISDMVGLINSGTPVVNGWANAWWMVAKKGANYGVRVATEQERADAETAAAETA